MVMCVVAAVNGYKVFFCAGYCVVNKYAGLYYLKSSNSVKSVVNKITNSSFGNLSAACVKGSYFYFVCARLIERDSYGSGSCFLRVNGSSVGCGNVNLIPCSAVRFPAYGFSGDVNCGHVCLVIGIISVPYSKQSCICGENRAVISVSRRFFKAVCQSVGLIFHAYPPTAEGVTFSYGNSAVIKFSAYRNGIRNLSTFVTEVVADGVFNAVFRLLSPTRIYFYVSIYRLRTKYVRGCISFVRIPA